MPTFPHLILTSPPAAEGQKVLLEAECYACCMAIFKWTHERRDYDTATMALATLLILSTHRGRGGGHGGKTLAE